MTSRQHHPATVSKTSESSRKPQLNSPPGVATLRSNEFHLALPEDFGTSSEELESGIVAIEEILRVHKARLTEDCVAGLQDMLALPKFLVWNLNFLKAIEADPTPGIIKRHLAELQIAGAIPGVVIMHVRRFFDESSNPWAEKKKRWREAGTKIKGIQKLIEDLNTEIRSLPSGIPSLTALFNPMILETSQVERRLNSELAKDLKKLGDKRTRTHRHVMLEHVVAYLEGSTGGPRYGALASLLHIGSVCAGKEETFEEGALSRQVRRLRSRFPEIREYVDHERTRTFLQKIGILMGSQHPSGKSKISVRRLERSLDAAIIELDTKPSKKN